MTAKWYLHGVKRFAFFLLLLAASCSLNGTQEAALQKSMSEYIEAHNNDDLVKYLEYSHPDAIRYYKDLGHDEFKEHFSLASYENSYFLQDGILKDTESDGNTIHAKYEYIGIMEVDMIRAEDPFVIFAVSVDNGKSWYFLPKEDYFNKSIIKTKDRLIDK